MSEHTPGPWTYSRSEQYGDWRFYVAQADGARYTPHYSDVATLIAETVSDERRSIQEANARLIAAAPDLLEALSRLIEIEDGPGMAVIGWEGAMERAYAAIAKARGEQ